MSLILCNFKLLHAGRLILDVIQRMNSDEAAVALTPMLEKNSQYSNSSTTINDCWRELQIEKDMRWLHEWYHASSTATTPAACIKMKEFLNYDNLCEGGVHVIISDRLLAFPCPTDLPEDPKTNEIPHWKDVNGKRLFDVLLHQPVSGL